jgi:hypothetical protein
MAVDQGERHKCIFGPYPAKAETGRLILKSFGFNSVHHIWALFKVCIAC